RQRHDLYAKYHDYDSEISDLLGECGIKVLNVGNILPNGTIDLSRTDRHLSVEEFDRKYRHFAVDAGDLVIASSGISFDEDGFLRTKVAFVHEQHLPLCMNTSTIRFKAKTDVSDLAFLRHWFQSASFRTQISRLVTGSAQLNFGPSHLKQMTIPLPPLEEQKRIAAILDQADALRRLRARALDRLNALGQAIFQEMFGDDQASAERQKLGEVCVKIGSGATPRGGDSAYKEQGVPLIRSMNVRDGFFDRKGLAFLDDAQADGLKNVIVQGRDVLLNITGASVARVCIAPPELSGARVNQHVAIIRPNRIVVPEFLEAFLLLPKSKSELLRIAEAGATRQAITKAQIEDFEVPILPLAEQQKFLDRRNEVANQTLVAERQAMAFDQLFGSLQHRAFRGEL
ncbi:restriction endonuclease, partial [Rhodobacter sp. HX-7-19]